MLHCLEEVGCIGTNFVRIVTFLLIEVYDNVLIERCPYELNEQLRIIKYLYSTICMLVNVVKTKVMIIKSKNITCDNFVYENKKFDEVTS
jgi:hypothetical protein